MVSTWSFSAASFIYLRIFSHWYLLVLYWSHSWQYGGVKESVFFPTWIWLYRLFGDKVFIQFILETLLQSRLIKMRTPILYLANRWTKFKMLLTSNRFLYLIRFLLLSFPLIPQFIAQFRSICLFLCSSPYFLPVATKWELEQSMHCPLCHCCHSFLFSPSERTKWRSKKVLKSLS